MNTGIQDAHALAWRIATWRAVDAASSTGRLDEEPGDSERARLGEDPDVVLARLMRSYERERRPVAVGNTRLSVANLMKRAGDEGRGARYLEVAKHGGACPELEMAREAFGEASAAEEPDGVTRIVGSRVPKVLRTPRVDDLVDEARE